MKRIEMMCMHLWSVCVDAKVHAASWKYVQLILYCVNARRLWITAPVHEYLIYNPTDCDDWTNFWALQCADNRFI